MSPSRPPPPTPRSTICHRLQNNPPRHLHPLPTSHNLNRLPPRLIPRHINPAPRLCSNLIDLAPAWADNEAVSLRVRQDEVARRALILSLLECLLQDRAGLGDVFGGAAERPGDGAFGVAGGGGGVVDKFPGVRVCGGLVVGYERERRAATDARARAGRRAWRRLLPVMVDSDFVV